jgi:hypothetical protein
MPLDIAKSHTKTEINLSKPYHQGSLLIDLKSQSLKKSLIDIKPIRKVSIQQNINNEFKPTEGREVSENSQKIEDKAFVGGVKAPTLDFDKLEKFDDLLNPFTLIDNKSSIRNASEIKINTELQPEFNKNGSNLSRVKQLCDIKKTDEKRSNISFSSLKPKINVAPLHSRSRSLIVINQSSDLSKKIKDKRIQSKNYSPIDGYNMDLQNFKTTFENVNFEGANDADFFQFKAPPKFDASDIPQFSQQNNINSVEIESGKVNLHELNNELHNSNLRKKIRNQNKFKRYSVSTLFTTVIIIFCTLFLTGNAQWMGKFGEKNVQADKSKNTKTVSYEKWIASSNLGKYSSPGEDLDKDGLNNYEEFLIGSIPTNKNSCNVNVSDNENLLNLIDPVNCAIIDFNAPGQISRFKDVLNITPEFILKHQSQILQNQSFITPSVQVNDSIISVSQSSATVVTDILPVPNVEINTPNTPNFIEASTKIDLPKLSIENPLIKKTPEENKKIEPKLVEIPAPKNNVNVSTVQQYIDQYRSYDKYDNQIANPVNADYFINMSEKYNVPLKYTLALARSESRFGTDQFNQDGSGNRIGRHLNMYSIGLDDDGGSITYPSWEAGVDAFGWWYTNFENQGYSDCAKWRIYNPNGDYCQKIENLASQISNYIDN